MRRRESRCARPLRRDRLALRADAALGPCARRSSIWCSRAPEAATRARSPRRSRTSAGDQRLDRPRPDRLLRAACWPRTSAAVREPAPDLIRRRTSAERTSSARRRDPVRSSARRRYARRSRPRSSVRGGVRRPAARPLGARPSRPSAPSRIDDCIGDRTQYRPEAPDPGRRRQARSRPAARLRRGGCSATWRAAPIDTSRSPPISPAARRFERRKGGQGPYRAGDGRPEMGRPRTPMRRSCSLTSSAWAPHRGCFSSFARTRASLIRSPPARRITPMRACSGRMSPRDRGDAELVHREIERVLAEAA